LEKNIYCGQNSPVKMFSLLLIHIIAKLKRYFARSIARYERDLKHVRIFVVLKMFAIVNAKAGE